MRIAALSIEGSAQGASLHIAVAQTSLFGQARVLAHEEAPLPEQDDARQHALLEHIERLKKDHGIEAMVVGLDFKNFAHHFVEVPVKKHEEVRQALGFELERHLPLPPDEYIFDFVTIEETQSGSRNFVVAVRKDRLAWIESAARQSGLHLLGVRCIALESMSEFVSTGPKQDVVFMFPEGGAYCMFGIKDGLPHSVRAVSPDRPPLAELEKLTKTFNKGIFSARGYKAEHFPNEAIKDLRHQAAPLLAQAVNRRKGFALDFTPPALREQARDLMTPVLWAMASLAVAIYFLTTVVGYYKDSSALARVEQQIEDIKVSADKLVQSKASMDEATARTEFLFEFRAMRNDQIGLLRHLSTVLPKDAWLTNYSCNDKGEIALEGIAKKTSLIVAPLENSEKFSDVTFSSPVSISDGQERFSISMQVQGFKAKGDDLQGTEVQGQ